MPINAVIIRTSWLYSEFGNNFVKTIIKLGKERNELNIVVDQIGSPTYATDLAVVIISIIKSEVFSGDSQPTEIYHYSNEGEISWYDFAKEVIELADIQCSVNPITTDAYPAPAQRPKNTVMQNDNIARIFGLKIVDWKTSLRLLFEKRLS
jgi:dTDP-4-dehydrorhamnose reductase